MNPRTALITVAALLISIAAILIGWKLGQQRRRPQDAPEIEAVEVAPDSGAVVELFFPGPAGRLHTEQRALPPEPEIETYLTRLLEELLAGPASPDLYPALPTEISLGWIHVNPQGVVYVDLETSSEAPLPSWGSRQEMLAVYSVVNTVLTNVSGVEALVLLRNGQQHSTFAGHLDTSRPLLANQDLVARR